MKPTITSLILAAGQGRRASRAEFGAPSATLLPKQFKTIAGEMVLTRTLQQFLTHPAIDTIVLVTDPDQHTLRDQACQALQKERLIFVDGGKTRQDSAYNGLLAIQARAMGGYVLVHDGARPLVDHDVITRVIAALDQHQGAVAALPVSDTLKYGTPHHLYDTADRTRLWRAQTPQGFHVETILHAYEKAAQNDVTYTDDAAIAQASGVELACVTGCERNIKLTRPEDFALASALLGQSFAFRTGQGFDVHAFCAGNAVTLCGVRIPHTHALAGHSDADVALHALTDALFGAIAYGDIGDHFPPDDPLWAGVASHVFLEKALEELAKRNGTIVNCDVTLICEAPKIAPYRQEMRTALSQMMQLAVARISVKATTTERLGFTGRQEGIAALATMTVKVPDIPYDDDTAC